MNDAVQVIVGFIYSGMRFGTPYLYAALGETISQRSGVLNLGVEGIMLMGAYTAFFVAKRSTSLLLGLLCAILVGLFMGLLMAYLSVSLRANQTICGIGLFMFGFGLSSFLYAMTLGGEEMIDGFAAIRIPVLSSIPYLGEALFRHNALVYGAFLLVPLSNWFLNKTRLGLSIRAVGQNPQAADSLGVDVVRTRYLAVSLGGLLAALGGASLSIGIVNIFQENMTGGIGFIAVALVYFGGWMPGGVLMGAMLLSLVNALQLWFQIKGIKLPSNLIVMMPYVITLIALMFAGRAFGKHTPDALCQPFSRGEE